MQKMANKAQAAKILKTRINKGKTRISAGFSLAEMEGFELCSRFLLIPKRTVNFVQSVPCFIEHRLSTVGVAVRNGIRRVPHHFLNYSRVDTGLLAVGREAVP